MTIVSDVAARTGLDEGAARSLVGRVLRGIGRACGPGECQELAAVLPGDLSRELRAGAAGGGGDNLVDREVFVGPIVQSLDTEYGYDQTLGGLDLVSSYLDDDAARRVMAVFGALKERMSPGGVEILGRALPPEISDWFREA